MHQYLIDTEFAAKNLLQLATEEKSRLRELESSLINAEAKFQAHQWDFRTSDMNDDFSDAHVMAAFGRMASAHKEAEAIKVEFAVIQASIHAREHAVQAIAAALLQIARQGMSASFGDVDAVPTGRMIGSLPIRDIIWQARNQALHFEEGSFRKTVTALFSTLEAEQGQIFSLTQHLKQSRAKQVMELLNWDSYEAYRADMVTLLPTAP